MATAQQIVEVARSQIGVKEQPANSNRTKYGKWYGMDGEPWCDMFVSWCADQAGALEEVGKFAYCPYHVNFFKQRGQWIDREEEPRPGDIVFYAGASGLARHVGIVVSRNGSESITAIEGNTSVSSDDNGGAVMERVREYGAVGSSWYIMGFGRPAYECQDDAKAEPSMGLRRIDIPEGDYPVYRLYNANTGEHFFTSDAVEHDELVRLGWNDEGIGWTGADTGAVVYRMYNPVAGDHMYTMSYDEAKRLEDAGWAYEGSVFASGRDGYPVYRLYNPNSGRHMFTPVEAERDKLMLLGWDDEGIAFFAS